MGKTRFYLRAPGASLVSFATVNYWVSTSLQFFLNKRWWLLILILAQNGLTMTVERRESEITIIPWWNK